MELWNARSIGPEFWGLVVEGVEKGGGVRMEEILITFGARESE